LDLISALPSGIMRWSPELENLVESSVNLPVVQTEDYGIFLLMAARSSSETQLLGLSQRIRAISHLAGANVKVGNSYPGWHPDLDSKILAACKVAYLELFKREPVVTAIHAGLETGIIGKKYPKMEMISMGPTVEHAHSPDERVNIPSVKEFYDLLLVVIKKLGETK
jgi:dipeptidase D